MVKIDQRSESSGYYYDTPKIGRAQLSRYYYHQDTRPLLQGDCLQSNTFSQSGGNIIEYSFNYFVNLLAPLGKDRLMAVIVLLVLNHFKKFNKQVGGSANYLAMAEKTLAPLGKNVLVVMGALLLLDYFTRNKKMLGGGDNAFMKKLVELLRSKYKQTGGNMIAQLSKIVMPAGINVFKATTLLILLDRLFKGNKRRQQGGCPLLDALRQAIAPLGINKLLTAMGLIALTQTNTKFKKHLQKGGDCGCGGILKKAGQSGGGLFGSDNCNCGANTLEVVGDKALNYSMDLQQFGCKIPEWGSNLLIDGQAKCL